MFLLGFLSMALTSATDILLGISVGIFTVACLFLNVTNSLSLLMMLMPFLSFTFTFNEMYYFSWICSMFALVLLIKYIIECCKGKKKIFFAPLIITIVIVLYGFYNFKLSNLWNFYSNLLLLGSCYLCFCYYKEIDVKKICTYFVVGLLASIFLTCLTYSFSGLRHLVLSSYGRLKFFCSNPNYMQAQAIIALAIIVVAVFKCELRWYYSIPSAAIICAAGFITNSKTFLVLLVILALLYIVSLVRTKNKQNVLPAGVFVLIFAMVIFACSEYILETIERFGSSGFDKVLDNILTGRYTIWKTYLTDWASSPISIIFGKGVCYDILGIGEHSSYIMLLYEYGIVGIALIIGLICSYVKCSDRPKNLSFVNFIPLICFLLNIVEESFLGKKCSWLLILCLMVAFVQDEKKNKISDCVKGETMQNGNANIGMD